MIQIADYRLNHQPLPMFLRAVEMLFAKMAMSSSFSEIPFSRRLDCEIKSERRIIPLGNTGFSQFLQDNLTFMDEILP